MTAMETLLATSFEKTFTDFVDNKDTTKIKSCLFENYQITLSSSLKDFHKFEDTTKKVLGDKSIPVIRKTFEKICHLESESHHIIEIKDDILRNAILSAYQDPLKKHILDIAFDYPLTLWEIVSRIRLECFSVSENLTYLISHGLLTTKDLKGSEYNKKYYSTIDEISVRVEEEKFRMFVRINDIPEKES